jgi:hypothetical protein
MKRLGMRIKGSVPWIISLVVATLATFQLGAKEASPQRADTVSNVVAVQLRQRDAYRGVHAQIPNVAVPIAKRYPRAAKIGLGIVVVPDPLVPRYRRMYDLSIAAIELGMLKDGFVLDRYAFPWDEELRRPTTADSPEARDSAESSGTMAKANDQQGEPAETAGLNSGSYGLIVFRCDSWRGDSCRYANARSNTPRGALPLGVTGPHIRALYVVTETATAGVARRQLRCAIRKVESQTSRQILTPDDRCPAGSEQGDYHDNTTLLEYPIAECRAVAGVAPYLLVLGPNFSGSMDSIGMTVDEVLIEQQRKLCLIASSATNLSNGNVSSAYHAVVYRTTALEDDRKILHIAKLSKMLGAQGGKQAGDVAILTEASTFGYGVCAPSETAAGPVEQFCQSPKFYFPPTLADIRFGVQQQQAAQAGELSGAARQLEHDQHLPLEIAAENGSEFPESHQSVVTAAGIQLQLDQVFAALVESAPKIVVVAATDVRDRLFLFDQLREKLPRALLIDLEADNLLAHPEFLHASRGGVVTASVNLTSRGNTFGCEAAAPAEATRAAWSTDTEGMLAENVARLQESDPSAPQAKTLCYLPGTADRMQRQAALQVITFNGFTPVSYAFPQNAAAAAVKQATALPVFDLLPKAEYLAVLFCCAIPTFWLWPWVLQPMSDRLRMSVLHRGWAERIVLGIVSILCIPTVALAPFVAHQSSVQSAHPLTYWVMAIEVIGLLGLWRCYVQIRHTLWSANHRYYSGHSLACCLALIAVLFSATPIWMSMHCDPGSVVDRVLMFALGFDPYSGLGFYLVVALTTLTLLYTSAILATRTWIMRRNFHLLFLAHERSPGSTPFVVTKEMEESEQSRLSAPHRYRPLPMWIIVLTNGIVILVLAVPGLVDQLGGPRLTVFGPFAARVAVLALSATTLCAVVLVVGVFGAGRRIRMLSGYVRGRAIDHGPCANPRESGEILNAWVGGANMPIIFPATPVLARVGATGAFRRHTMGEGDIGGKRSQYIANEWARSLSQILFKGNWDSSHRLALYALLAAEMSLFRWIALGAIICTLVSVTIAYLYPIEADVLLVINLVLLATTGVLGAYLAVQFECDEVLSFVLCNRPKKAQISIGLFTYMASPFVALAGAVAIVSVPGVVDWAGGLLAMLRALGVHG